METAFLNYKLLDHFDVSEFQARSPFPWARFEALLTSDGFGRLSTNYPSVNLFEEHKGLKRHYDQKPHDRYYLAYQESIHHPGEYVGRGVVKRQDLKSPWRDFIDELETGPYQSFVARALGGIAVKPRYDWHIGVRGSEVSPHVDANAKVATHCFYFNGDTDWNSSWGGQFLILEGNTSDTMSPRFEDFTGVTTVEILNNCSILFRNTGLAWHGVRPLTCPTKGAYRRLFNVVFERIGSDDQPILFRAGMA